MLVLEGTVLAQAAVLPTELVAKVQAAQPALRGACAPDAKVAALDQAARGGDNGHAQCGKLLLAWTAYGASTRRMPWITQQRRRSAAM